MKNYFYEMDSKFIVERLQNIESLKKDSLQSWDKLTKDYPYFAIGQWLRYGQQFYQGQDDIRKAALYKSEPLEFAKFISRLKNQPVKEAEEVQIVEIVSTTNSQKAIEEIRTTEVIENLTAEASIESKEEAQTSIPSNQKEEDILELINELPNTSVFTSPKLKTESVQDIPSITEAPSPEADELKSLLVMMSFTEWLNHFKHKSEKDKIEKQEQRALKTAWQREKLAAAADEEIEEIPEPIFKQAMDSIAGESGLISEALAEILAKQGKKDKAIAMYKKLSLRNPEKYPYFADRINDLNLNND